ncbi:MAG: hypothetical protein CME70_17575 [Halobacteriovorax sp.]|nr:hypothetical protein [Halobacteriovorax sp.]
MKKIKIPTDFQMEYDLRLDSNAKRNYLVLHGFYENASIIKEKLEPLIPKDSNLLIPNGCFPLPKRKSPAMGGGWDLFFSWYFFDESSQSFYVEYDFPAGILEKLVVKLGLEKLPLTIIGYSQGGYLSPFVAERLSNCDQVIGIGCSYKFDMLKDSSHYKIEGIHGSADDKVDPVNAKTCFSKLDSKIKGEFIMLENQGHKLSKEFYSKISLILK